MSKSYKDRPSKVQVQKGPIEMDAQYTYKFMGKPEKIMEDLRNDEMRRSGHTMTFHEPKK